MFFETSVLEKGWVVSLKQNKSEFGEFKISKSWFDYEKLLILGGTDGIDNSQGDVLFIY